MYGPDGAFVPQDVLGGSGQQGWPGDPLGPPRAGPFPLPPEDQFFPAGLAPDLEMRRYAAEVEAEHLLPHSMASAPEGLASFPEGTFARGVPAQTGSAAPQALRSLNEDLFAEPGPDELSRKQEMQDVLMDRLEDHIEDHTVPSLSRLMSMLEEATESQAVSANVPDEDEQLERIQDQLERLIERQRVRPPVAAPEKPRQEKPPHVEEFRPPKEHIYLRGAGGPRTVFKLPHELTRASSGGHYNTWELGPPPKRVGNDPKLVSMTNSSRSGLRRVNAEIERLRRRCAERNDCRSCRSFSSEKSKCTVFDRPLGEEE